jgi:hypothetical protein
MIRAGITSNDLIEFFQPRHEGGIRIPQFYSVPEDAVCLSVNYNEELEMFVMTFYHEEFSKVPHGEMIPVKATDYRIIEFLEPEDA